MQLGLRTRGEHALQDRRRLAGGACKALPVPAGAAVDNCSHLCRGLQRPANGPAASPAGLGVGPCTAAEPHSGMRPLHTPSFSSAQQRRHWRTSPTAAVVGPAQPPLLHGSTAAMLARRVARPPALKAEAAWHTCSHARILPLRLHPLLQPLLGKCRSKGALGEAGHGPHGRTPVARCGARFENSGSPPLTTHLHAPPALANARPPHTHVPD